MLIEIHGYICFATPMKIITTTVQEPFVFLLYSFYLCALPI